MRPGDTVNAPLLVAPVRGLAAMLLARSLEDAAAIGRAVVAAGHADPAELVEALETLAAIQRAADEYRAWRLARAEEAAKAGVDARAGVLGDARGPDLPGEVDTADAAIVLRLSRNRVRALCRIGALPSRRAGRVWLVKRSAMQTYGEVHSGSL